VFSRNCFGITKIETMNKKIWLSSPHMGGGEMKYIKEAFSTNWVAPLGPNVNEFEKGLANKLGITGVAALNSGTAAIHLALIILGVKQGDEVICSSFTFSATANPIMYQFATPIFIDSEADTWNMDPELLETAIRDRIKKGNKPKAIVLVHLYGMPAKINDILEISRRYEIPLIEDAAEALGSRYNDKSCGIFGELGILSFNGNKIITTSGGGALISGNFNYIDKARYLATQARDKAPHYQHSEVGYNYRMSNIVAGIGRGQLEVLEDRIRKRRDNNRYYRDLLRDFESISFQNEPLNHFSNFWLTTIFMNSSRAGMTKDIIRLGLERENIESRPLWKPMHLQPVFAGYPSYLNGVSEKLFQNGLCLPSGSNLSDIELNRISDCLTKILKQ
jgi:dTDP-4-amino-4,6-dideoxygalactose transaminase